MRILFIDDSNSNVEIFDDVSDFLDSLNDENISMERSYYGEAPKAFFLPDDLVEVRVSEVNSPRFRVSNSPDGSDTSIPAPLPGETVSDYARRITGA